MNTKHPAVGVSFPAASPTVADQFIFCTSTGDAPLWAETFNDPQLPMCCSGSKLSRTGKILPHIIPINKNVFLTRNSIRLLSHILALFFLLSWICFTPCSCPFSLFRHLFVLGTPINHSNIRGILFPWIVERFFWVSLHLGSSSESFQPVLDAFSDQERGHYVRGWPQVLQLNSGLTWCSVWSQLWGCVEETAYSRSSSGFEGITRQSHI